MPLERLELGRQSGKGSSRHRPWSRLEHTDPKAKLKLVDFMTIGVKDVADDPNAECSFADATSAEYVASSTGATEKRPPKKSRRSTSPEGVRIKRYGGASTTTTT